MTSSAPTPSFLRGIQSQTWSAAGALSEIIDNSFGSGRGNAGNVWIDYDRTGRMLYIVDDGVGMRRVVDLFKLGSGSGMTPGDIGRYGMGGAMAILWLADHVTVWTLRDGKVSSHKRKWKDQFEADHFFDVPDTWVAPTAKNCPSQLLNLGQGTFIAIKLGTGRKMVPDAVIAELADTYAPGLRDGRRITWATLRKGKVESKQELAPADLSQGEVRGTVSFDGVIDHQGHALPIRGEATLSDLPLSRSKLAIGFAHRVILRTTECFTDPHSGKSYHGLGVSGWVDLGEGWQIYLSTTKDGFNDDVLRDKVNAYLFSQIQPLLDDAEQAASQIELSNIGISLNKALSASRDFLVDGGALGPSEEEGEQFSERGDSEVDTPSDDKDVGTDETDRDDQSAEANSFVEMREATDHELEGTLCNVRIQSDGRVIAFVNAEHQFVRDSISMKSRTRPALIAIVVRELAHELANSGALLRSAFRRPRTLKAIEARDGEQRTRYIARIIVDLMATSEAV